MTLEEGVKEEKISPKDIQKYLNNIDLKSFWRKVEEAMAPDIEAYKKARAESYARAGNHVVLSNCLAQ